MHRLSLRYIWDIRVDKSVDGWNYWNEIQKGQVGLLLGNQLTVEGA